MNSKNMHEQFSLFDVVGDSIKVSPTKHDAEAKTQAIQRFLEKAQEKPAASISTYKPNNRKTEYFRLVYRVGKKVKTVHICGGNINSKLAQYRANKLQQMIDRSAELGELLAALETFNSDRD